MKWAIGILAVSACASEPRVPVALEDYRAALLEAGCRTSARCGAIASFERCRQEFAQLAYYAPPSISLVASVDRGVVKFDGIAARDCVDAIASESCVVSFEGIRDPYACTQVFIGTIAGSGGCELSEECVSGNCNVPDCGQACCPGTCVDAPRWYTEQIGDACTFDFECKDGLYCGNHKCAAPVEVGSSCADGEHCAKGSVCLSQRCVRLPGVGEPCHDILTCSDVHADLVCNPTSHVCEKPPQLGEPCGPDRMCPLFSHCDETSHCSTREMAFGSACKVLEDSCSDRDAFCHFLDMQDGAACARFVPDGAPCDALHVCARGTCDTDTHTCDPGPVCL